MAVLATVLACSRSCAPETTSAGEDTGKRKPEVIGDYRLTPGDGGTDVFVAVPAIGLSAWLPDKPRLTSGSLVLKGGDSLPQEELAVAFLRDPGVGCSISWLRYEGRPAPDLDALLKAHAQRMHASILRSRDVTFGDGRSKEAELSLSIAPNIGTVRVRLALHREHVILGHAYVHQSDRVDPVVARCLSSITLERDAGPETLEYASFTKAAADAAEGNIVQIVAGKDGTCARTEKGAVYCWGDNAFTSTTKSARELAPPVRTTPARVGGIANAADLDIAATHGCAVEAGGGVSCWTDGTVDGSNALVATGLGVKDAVAVRASVGARSRFCFLHKDGRVSCSSFEPNGPRNAPSPVQGLVDVTAIAPGDLHTCALNKRGAVVCWGSTASSARDSPGGLPPILTGVTALSTGSAVSCAIRDERAFCWGSNEGGQATGVPNAVARSPVEVAGLPQARRVVAGVNHSCAITKAGGVRCWGDDRFGQRGPSGTSGDIAGIGTATDIAVGEFHTCALVGGGDVWCWGRNQRGQLGDGTAADRSTPVRIRW